MARGQSALDTAGRQAADDADYYSPPLDINYNILGLHKKRHFNKGELYKVDYYGNYNFSADTYSDLILHEERTYYRINELVYKREMDICWHLSDGSSGSTKHTTKYYTKEDSYKAGERRRRNCITTLKIGTVGLIMNLSGVTQLEAEEIGLPFLNEFNVELGAYVEGAEELLFDALMTTTNYDWLDGYPPMLGGAITIRQYLYDQISIDYTENNTTI